MTSHNIALAIAADLKKTHIADGRYDRLMFELVNEIARRNSANNRVFVRPDKRCVKSKVDAIKAWFDAV
jgi:hypothetical protein